MRRLAVGVFVVLMCTAVDAVAQTEGSIRGYVRDEQGGVLPGVTMTVTSADTAKPRFAPGAISRDATNNQAPVFYVHGSGITSSSTLIDGADMTSAINPWAGYAALPEDTISDVQLKTSGLDAAAPLGMGVAANVVTKSGTNAFKGSGTFTYSPKSWIGNNAPAGGTPESASLRMPEFAIGGPIAR